METKTIPIKGMHCRSCEILIEDEIMKVNGVKKVIVNEKRGSAQVFFKGLVNDEILKKAVQSAGYEVGLKEAKPLFSHNRRDYEDLGIAFFILTALYFIGNDLGLFNISLNSGGSYGSLGVVFLVGLTAGISTCMALVGGLVLAASARFVEMHPRSTTLQKFKPHIFFNLGRIISFTILGGVIGYAGSFFQLSSTMLGLMTVIVGGVMVIMGLQLTEIFPRLSGIQFTLPKSVSRAFGIKEQSEKEYSHKNSFILGASTFFLPCGFTQAMQLFAISSGSPLTGALTMGVFALGTAPGLLGIGGLTSVIKGSFTKPFFKFAGLIVIFMAIFNISNGLNLSGIEVSAIALQKVAVVNENDPNVKLVNGVQEVRMTQGGSGYSPNTFTIKKGIPVKWIVTSENAFTCAASIISPKLGVRKNLELGENIIEFTPTESGNIRFTCSMGMYSGTFNIIENSSKTTQENTTNLAVVKPNQNEIIPTIASGACGGGGGCDSGQKAERAAAIEADQIPPIVAEKTEEAQVIKASYSIVNDVQPNKFTVKVGSPVKFDITAEEDGQGCMGSIMIPGLDDRPQGFEKGKVTTLAFTPSKPGSYTITCAMGVPRGTIIVE